MSGEISSIMAVFWAGVTFGLIPYVFGAAVSGAIRSIDSWHE